MRGIHDFRILLAGNRVYAFKADCLLKPYSETLSRRLPDPRYIISQASSLIIYFGMFSHAIIHMLLRRNDLLALIFISKITGSIGEGQTHSRMRTIAMNHRIFTNMKYDFLRTCSQLKGQNIFRFPFSAKEKTLY